MAVEKPRGRYEQALLARYPNLKKLPEKSRMYDVWMKTSYTPDIVLPNGLYLELKGYHPHIKTWLKMLGYALQQNPDLKKRLRILLEKDYRIPRTKHLMMSEKLRKMGVIAATGYEIPPEWLTTEYEWMNEQE
jgi:hypothetical protein